MRQDNRTDHMAASTIPLQYHASQRRMNYHFNQAWKNPKILDTPGKIRYPVSRLAREDGIPMLVSGFRRLVVSVR